MTDQHPLTEEMMDKIHGDDPGYSNPYDEDDMRAAADWQLEQAIEWLKLNTDDYLLEDFYKTYFLTEAFLDGFKKAMRPTTQEPQ